MGFEIVPAHEIALGEQARLGNEAFKGYVGGWTELDVPLLARFICSQGVDLCHSRFVRGSGALVGFGYINRTGNVARLAGMGLMPAARGSGAAAFLLEQLVAEAKQRGDKSMMLEVIQQNPRAHRLYQRHGFVETDQLFGWRRAAATEHPGLTTPAIHEIEALEALLLASAEEYPKLPWQVSRHALAKAAVSRAFRGDHACVFIGDPDVTPVQILGFLGGSAGAMPWAELRAVLAAILARYPDREFLATPRFPAEHGEQIFQPLGFAREPISQFLMRRELHD